LPLISQKWRKRALTEVLPRVLDEGRPTPLHRLAEISDFSLYLTTTPDTLFERVLMEVRGLTPEDVCTFYLKEKGEQGKSPRGDTLDLPEGWEQPKPTTTWAPTLFYLFGRLGTEANFEITDEQRLEMLWRLQHGDYQPERLMRELRHGHILLLGTRLPDWMGRYFIRLLRGHRLVESGGSTEALADLLVVAPGPPAPFVAFLDTFSQSTRIYRGGDPAQFIEELHRRWLDQRKATQQKAAKPQPLPDIAPPPRDLEGDGCFISYLREDALAAAALYKALRAAGLPVWLDLEEMRGGDRIDDKIRPNVQHAAFFLPLLSANTRGKGAISGREWNWAIKHNADFTGIADRGYLRPIIVDTTPKDDFKEVPADFTAVHIEVWPRGEPTAQFLAQILAAHQIWVKRGSAT
jgi:TIR domain-containing protein